MVPLLDGRLASAAELAWEISTPAGHSIHSPPCSSPTPVVPPQPLAGLQSNWMAETICISSNSLPIPTWRVSLNPDPFSNPLQSTVPQTAVLAQLQQWSTTNCQVFPLRETVANGWDPTEATVTIFFPKFMLRNTSTDSLHLKCFPAQNNQSKADNQQGKFQLQWLTFEKVTNNWNSLT